MRELARQADRVCNLILHSDLPEVDIDIEIARLRECAEQWFPGREHLFEMIYESRFARLREQFGADRRGPGLSR